MTKGPEKFEPGKEKEGNLPDIILPSQETEKFYVDLEGRTSPDLGLLDQDLPVELEEADFDEIIKFEDLPIIWQEHINKRKAGGFLPADKNVFTKHELLKASSAENSFTPAERIDKVFDRINKDKIDFADLPLAWQERLKNENVFGNFTVEYLKERGALDKDIAKIKADAQAKKVAGLKEDIEKTATSFLNPEEAGQAFLHDVTEMDTPATEAPVKKSWWGRVRSRFGF